MLCRLESVVFLFVKLERVRTERKREVGGKGSRTVKFAVEEREARNVACSKEERIVRLSNACTLAPLKRTCVCVCVCVRTNVCPYVYICKRTRTRWHCVCVRVRAWMYVIAGRSKGSRK